MPTAHANGINLYYEIHGEGEPLLLINGLADDVSAWVNQLDAFSSRYRTIVFDTRGVGASEVPPGGYTTQQMAADAACLLDALGIERAHVLGTSMGGMIAQELAIAYPERVNSLVLCCTSSEPTGANLQLYRFWELSARRLGLGDTMREVMVWCFSEEFFQTRPEEAAKTEEAFAAITQPVEAYLSQLHSLVVHNATARLGQIQAHTLILAAPHDLLYSAGQAEQLRRGIPRSILQYTAHGGHSFRKEVPEEFNQAVLEGLDRLSEPDAFAARPRFLNGHGPHRPREVLAGLLAEAGDTEETDFYGEGPLVESFERELAELLGKEAAVFVPSGTMAQQIALRIWSDRHGSSTVLYHPTCHLENREHKGYQRLHGLHARLVGNPHSLLTLIDLQAVAEPFSSLLIELPQRHLGGIMPTWDELEAQVAWVRERGAAAHMDGARLWDCAPHYGRSPAEVAALFDSVYVSFFKGLGAITGAALAGPSDFVAEARVWIRRHGGSVFRIYPMVLSARAALRLRLPRLPEYYRRALAIADVLSAIPGIQIKPNPPQSNMMHVLLRGNRARLLEAGAGITHREGVILFDYLAATDVPDVWKFELSVGDAVERITDEEIGALFAEVIAAGGTI